MNNKKGGILLGLLVVILVAHVLGMFRDWYHTIPDYDVPMHLLGGAWVVLFIFYLTDKGFPFLPSNYQRRPLISLCTLVAFAALVGVFWELFEYSFDVFIAHKYVLIPSQDGLLDTIKDLVDDVLGGGVMAGVHILSERLRA